MFFTYAKQRDKERCSSRVSNLQCHKKRQPFLDLQLLSRASLNVYYYTPIAVQKKREDDTGNEPKGDMYVRIPRVVLDLWRDSFSFIYHKVLADCISLVIVAVGSGLKSPTPIRVVMRSNFGWEDISQCLGCFLFVQFVTVLVGYSNGV